MKFLFTMIVLASSFGFAGPNEYRYECTTDNRQVVKLEYKYEKGYKITSILLNGADASKMVKSNSFRYVQDGMNAGPVLTLSGFPSAIYESEINFRRNLFSIGLGSGVKQPYAVPCVFTDLSKKDSKPPLSF